ncbi:DUF6332 family protein [Streptomyces spongiicola]|uniref:DUF6332 family protein n=1 Tax=Streptomyces spongiicola TaxID=1690221 RepID=UPI0033CC6818
MGKRTQAQRDESTVEIGYALFSGAFAAAVVFGAVAGPKLMFTMPYAVEQGLLLAAAAAAGLVFPIRVVTVLRRHAREADGNSRAARSGQGTAAARARGGPGSSAGSGGPDRPRLADGGDESGRVPDSRP